MFSHAHRVGTGIDRLFRGVAIVFLLFTCADLTSPEVCAEELLGYPPHLIAAAADRSEHATELALEMADGALPAHGDSEPGHSDEDCFCCCAHLLLSPHYIVPLDAPGLEPALALEFRLPTSAPPACYRPPRIV